MDANFDASCLTTLAVYDQHWPALSDWLTAHQPETLYSDFGHGEVVSAVGAQVRSQQLRALVGTRTLDALRERLDRWERLSIGPADVEAATMFIADFSLGLRLPDAIHLAIAQRHGATLITTDRRQGDAAAAPGIGYVDPTRPAKDPA